jgi:hypothetical protein
MKGINKLWLQFVFYAGALVISLVLQASRPDLFALFCTPLPLQNFLNPSNDSIAPSHTPGQTMERIK